MKPKRTWPGGILRGQSGACAHKIARLYSKQMPPLRQGTNPDFPYMTHAVTMAVTYEQLQLMVAAPYAWLTPIVRCHPIETSLPKDLRYFCNGNFLASVDWMWHARRSGIAVCIRDNKLALFVPFCNPQYLNRWSPQARAALPPIGLSPDKWWANGWTLCGDEVSEQLWSDHGVCAIMNMLMVCCEKKAMGDCDFIINKKDSACVRLDGCDAMNPFDMYQRPEQRPPLVPILSLYVGDQFADVAMPLPSDWHRLLRGTFEGQNPRPPVPLPLAVPWEQKRDCAVFRGSLTGAGGRAATHQRIALLHMHDGHNFDLMATSANRRLRFCPLERSVVMPDPTGLRVGRCNYVPMHEQQEQYRYIVTLDGHSGADRLAALMGGNQVVLKVDAPRHALCPDTWVSQRMYAWEHYVPVARSLHNLHERLAHARSTGCPDMRHNCEVWHRAEKDAVMTWWQEITQAMSGIATANSCA
jgi:hypothetical protein